MASPDWAEAAHKALDTAPQTVIAVVAILVSHWLNLRSRERETAAQTEQWRFVVDALRDRAGLRESHNAPSPREGSKR